MTVIKVENIGKRYQLGEKKKEPYDTFRNMLVNSARQSWRRMTGAEEAPQIEEFWALRNISFEVQEGQRLGIIGRNGAGKSTLLKLLSRITDPTEGRITMRGRVGSLLEVGTGFHPELTGRENVYLNGAVLGMSHKEIRRKFDEIVAFAEIEKFLDTPVKRYSSGMYVRLAFAVAAHLEPEVLIIDEVLAVGDAAFQKKCLGKMDEFGRSGRTVIFVSHSMDAVQTLCTHVMLLNKGNAEFMGDAKEASRLYMEENAIEAISSLATSWSNQNLQFKHPEFTPHSFKLTDETGEAIMGPVPGTKEVWVCIEGEIQKVDPSLNIGYIIYSPEGHVLYWSYYTDGGLDNTPQLKTGHISFRSRLPKRLFNEGDYRIELLGGLNFKEWFFEPGCKVPSLGLTIEGGLSDSPFWIQRRPGLLAPVLDWETQQ